MTGFLLDTNVRDLWRKPLPNGRGSVTVALISQGLQSRERKRAGTFPKTFTHPSELTRPQPDPQVQKWLDDADDERLYLSVVSLGEVLKGLTVLPAGKRRHQIEQWLDETLRPWFAGRILPVNEAIAERWGILAGQCQLRGRPLKVADGFIAATALEHRLTVVTRNVKDFAGLGINTLNPWS
jgi:predicted nucleic acid-binding protein